MPYKTPEAQRARQLRYYQANKARYCAWKRDHRARMQRWVEGLKTACQQCGYGDPRALEFHHRDRRHKIKAVGKMIANGNSRAKILAEIAKCDTLCANCHRILTNRTDSRTNNLAEDRDDAARGAIG